MLILHHLKVNWEKEDLTICVFDGQRIVPDKKKDAELRKVARILEDDYLKETNQNNIVNM